MCKSRMLLFWKCLYVSILFVSSACLIQFLIKYCSLTTILIFLMFSRTQPKTVFAEVEPEDDETDKPEWKKRKIWKIIGLKNHFRTFETKWTFISLFGIVGQNLKAKITSIYKTFCSIKKGLLNYTGLIPHLNFVIRNYLYCANNSSMSVT